MSKKSKLMKVITFLLIFSITTQTTSIAQILMYLGIPEYLGGVGERIAMVANGSYAKAALSPSLPSLENRDETDTGTGDGPVVTSPPAPTQIIIYEGDKYYLDCSCDFTDEINTAAAGAVASAAEYTNTTVATAMTAVQNAITECEEAILTEVEGSEARMKAIMTAGFETMGNAIGDMSTNITDAIEDVEDSIDDNFEKLLTDTNNILTAIGYENDGLTIIALLKKLCGYTEEIKEDVEEIKVDADHMNKVLSDLASSWFNIVVVSEEDPTGSNAAKPETVKGRTYNMYYLVDKMHEMSTVVVPSLGYGTENEETGGYKPNEERDDPATEYEGKRIWLEMKQESIGADLAQLNNNSIKTFGYYQYEKVKEDGETYLKFEEFHPSVAKDFATLLSYYKNYAVAHVYSVNCELGTAWQPTPDELRYSKERVLNEGFANAYLGFGKLKQRITKIQRAILLVMNIY